MQSTEAIDFILILSAHLKIFFPNPSLIFSW